MSYLDAVIYGIVQGLTEYLPISSSAHLILLPHFMKTEDPGLTFDVFVHVGTLLSTLVYFWHDWVGIFRTLPIIGNWIPFEKPSEMVKPKISYQPILVATLPVLVAGYLLHDVVEHQFRNPGALVFTLAVGGLVLFWSDRLSPRKRTYDDITMKDAVFVGLFQCLAIFPGVSRSGATITGGRLLKLDRAAAAKFSFLVSGPTILAATIYELKNWQSVIEGNIGLGPLVVALFSSFAFGLIAIGGLLRIVAKFSYLSFAMYRIALSVVVFFVLVKGG